MTSTQGLYQPACCNGTVYDAHFQLCCGGRLLAKQGSYPGCCGLSTYDSYTQLCCDGVVRVGVERQHGLGCPGCYVLYYVTSSAPSVRSDSLCMA